MTKLIIETDNDWTKGKIKSAIDTEIFLLKKTTEKIYTRINNFEKKYGNSNRENLYGKIDDMELIEWEGEVETLQKLQTRLNLLEEIIFEYK